MAKAEADDEGSVAGQQRKQLPRRVRAHGVELDVVPFDELAPRVHLPTYTELALNDGVLEEASRSTSGAPSASALLAEHLRCSGVLSPTPRWNSLRAVPLAAAQEPALLELEHIQRQEAEHQLYLQQQEQQQLQSQEEEDAQGSGSTPLHNDHATTHSQDAQPQHAHVGGDESASRRTRGRRQGGAGNASPASAADAHAVVPSQNPLLVQMRQSHKYSRLETYVRSIAHAAAEYAIVGMDVTHEEFEALCAGFERRAVRYLEKAAARERASTGDEWQDRRKCTRAWLNLVRRDIPLANKQMINIWRSNREDKHSVSEQCKAEAERRKKRTTEFVCGTPIRMQRLAREVVALARRGNSHLEDSKRTEEQRAAERRKREEEERERKRQEQRLNFLLTQTELYSHFMTNKVSESDINNLKEQQHEVNGQSAANEDADPEGFDETSLQKKAKEKAASAAMSAQRATQEFDEMSRQIKGADGEVGRTGDSMLAPSSMPTSSSVQQPKMIQANLKEYQLTGLQWLVNLYEQGINGILADEMGLGKTIQAIALLAHLAEEKNIWGPFVVIAPSSTLSNWIDELEKFAPQLITQPYWGSIEDRQVLRKNLQNSKLHSRNNAAFHVLVTSYEILSKDEKYFKRITWQFMVLDEAQAIKSSQSQRWKMLLSFSCRNRLLLTGTPVQNNMQELWALLHFIMPTLFDSQEQFSNWFSKGVEGSVMDGQALNEHQLKRLHQVLKPFMLRRVKADVESQMANKEEKIVECRLSSRQESLYEALRDEISLTGLLSGRAIGSYTSGTLMNAVMQLRKVCNHPELFERNEQSSSFVFKSPLPELQPGRGGVDLIPFNHHPELELHLPKLLSENGLVMCRSTESLGKNVTREFLLYSKMSIFRKEHVKKQMLPLYGQSQGRSGSFGFLRLFGFGATDVSDMATSEPLDRYAMHEEIRSLQRRWWEVASIREPEDYFKKKSTMLHVLSSIERSRCLFESDWCRAAFENGPLVQPWASRMFNNIALLRRLQACIFRVRAQPVEINVSDQVFSEWQRQSKLRSFDDWLLFSGASKPPPRWSIHRPIVRKMVEDWAPPLMQAQLQITGYAQPVQKYSLAQSLGESGKMRELDRLLLQLRSKGSRVLLFCQMVRMMDILEDYLSFRRLKYLRLDGSSSLAERRNMVQQFQKNDDVFVFLLSTRAGGQGINLTAADSVIFYESDWNPTLDLQAMDRAHRLGQNKNVTVYRFVCKNTIEEQILKRAGQKNTVQQLVMSSKQEMGNAPEEMVSLLKQDMTNNPLNIGPATGRRLGAIRLNSTGSSGRRSALNEPSEEFEGAAAAEPSAPTNHAERASKQGKEQQQRRGSQQRGRRSAKRKQPEEDKQRTTNDYVQLEAPKARQPKRRRNRQQSAASKETAAAHAGNEEHQQMHANGREEQANQKRKREQQQQAMKRRKGNAHGSLESNGIADFAPNWNQSQR